MNCRRCATPLEDGDLRCAICAMATEARPRAITREVARILRCEGCGAALTYSAEVEGLRCAFCAAVLRIEEPPNPLEVAERVVPFSVAPAQAQASVRAWLGTLGFFRPSDLARTAAVTGARPILWCGWLVEADALVSWAADSNAGSGRSAWAPHAGQTRMRFANLLVPASRGLRLDECRRLASSYDLRALGPAAKDDALVERFDVQRSAARSIVVDAIARTAAARLEAEGAIPGSRFRHLHVAALLHALHTERVALSAYVLAYRYKGKSYRAVVHGQDPRMAFGEAPYSIAKILLTIGGVLAAIAIVVAVAALARGR